MTAENKNEIIFLSLAIITGLIVGWFWRGKQINNTLPKADTVTVVTLKDSLIMRDSISIRDSFLVHKKYIYKTNTIYSPCDTDSRVFLQTIPDTNFIFLKLNMITRGAVDFYKINYQLKPERYRIVTEKTTIKEPYPVEVEGKYWKIYAGGSLRSDDRVKFNPGVLVAKDKLGFTAGYDFQYRNINVGFYYLIFKF